jgi:hypothetical protein
MLAISDMFHSTLVLFDAPVPGTSSPTPKAVIGGSNFLIIGPGLFDVSE